MRFVNNYIIDIIVACLFVATIAAYGIQFIDANTFLGILGSIVTMYFGIKKYKIETDRMFKELFESFNQRYDASFNDLINKLKTSEKELTIEETNQIIDYFNLSAEEYLWYSKRRIPSNVWKAWKAGIKENLKIEIINNVFKSETSSSNSRISYYGLVEELEKE